METIQIAPDGVPAEFVFEIPPPSVLTSLGGVRLYFTFNLAAPDPFEPLLYLGGQQQEVTPSSGGPLSMAFDCHLPAAVPAPVQAKVVVNSTGHLEPGSTVTVYAWGAQTRSGEGALNPDGDGEPTVMTNTIEVGEVQVVTWQEWRRISG